MEVIKEKKVSKLIVVLFVISILSIFGILMTGFNYSTLVTLTISTLSNIFIIWLTFFAKKRALKKNLSGLKMANFSIYVFVILAIIELSSSLILIKYSRTLDNFATNNTPTFFKNDLNELKNNATDNLKKVLLYGDTTKNVLSQFNDVGDVKECSHENNDVSEVNFGPYMKFNKVAIGMKGYYSVRCYADKKAFDFEANTEYKNGSWYIEDYLFDTQIDKNFDFQNFK